MSDHRFDADFSSRLTPGTDDGSPVYEPELGSLPDSGATEDVNETGTTTIGLTTTDGVVEAANDAAISLLGLDRSDLESSIQSSAVCPVFVSSVSSPQHSAVSSWVSFCELRIVSSRNNTIHRRCACAQ